jgi:hypothetical protein
MNPIIENIELVLGSPDLPKEVKERFVKKIGAIIDDLARYTPDDIKNFMLRQRSIAGALLPDNILYFFEKIIANQVANEFAFIPSLTQAYKESRLTSPTGQTFQQENLGRYTLSLRDIDQKLGTHTYERVLVPLLGGKMEALPHSVQAELRVSRDIISVNLPHFIGIALLEEL